MIFATSKDLKTPNIFFGDDFFEFLRNSFQQTPWIFEANSECKMRNAFLEKIAATDIGNLIGLALSHDECSVRLTKDSNSATDFDGHSIREKTEYILREYENGSSIVIQNIGSACERWNRYQEMINSMFPAKSTLNLYYTPANATRAFKVHYDTHDVFAAQVSGEKIWHYQSDSTLKRSQKRSSDIAGASPSLDLTVRLTPGSILYLPQGYYHVAEPTSTASVHLTIGVVGCSLMDVLYEVIASCIAREQDLLRSITWADFELGADGLAALELDRIYEALASVLHIVGDGGAVEEGVFQSFGAMIASQENPESGSTLAMDLDEVVKLTASGVGYSDDRLNLPFEFLVGKNVALSSISKFLSDPNLVRTLQMLRAR